MRILTVSNLYPPDGYGGYERQSRELVDELRLRGHEVSVLTCPVSTRSESNAEAPEMEVRRLLHLANEYMPFTNEKSSVEATILQSRLVSSHNVSVLIGELQRFRPDVVLLCNLLGLGGLQLLVTLNSLGVPWVWSLAEVVPAKLFDLDERSDLLSLLPFEKKGDKFVLPGTFVSLSTKLFDFISQDGCVLDGSRHVVPYWVNEKLDMALRADYSVGKTLRMCSVGYVDADKGLDILLRSLKLVVERGEKNFTVDIYGAGQIDVFQKMAADLGLSMVRFHGFRNAEELNAVYAEHDVMLFPAKLREPFGNVTLEPCLRGCVPIISQDCGAAEFLQHGETCLHANRTAESFADAIVQVLGGQIELAQMSRRAAADARTRFAISQAAARYGEIFEQVKVTFNATPVAMEEARLLAMYVERVAFVQLERDLKEHRTSTEWLKSEVAQLNDALASAKQGAEAYEMALVGEKNKLAECQQKLSILQNSRIWKIRRMLKPIFRRDTPEL